mgnify:CR=1 FL=1|jgi:hypothetical protein
MTERPGLHIHSIIEEAKRRLTDKRGVSSTQSVEYILSEAILIAAHTSTSRQRNTRDSIFLGLLEVTRTIRPIHRRIPLRAATT